jgi:hypothetical protein
VVHHIERGEKKSTILRHYVAISNPFHDEWLVVDLKCSGIIFGWSLLTCIWHDPEKLKVSIGGNTQLLHSFVSSELPVLAGEYFGSIWRIRSSQRLLGQKEFNSILQHGFERMFSNASQLASSIKRALWVAEVIERNPSSSDFTRWQELITPILRHTDLGLMLAGLKMEPWQSWKPEKEE